MSTKNIMIAGVTFAILAPYAAGHTLTEAEARVLNQTRSENIRNNQAETVKKMTAEGKTPEEALVNIQDAILTWIEAAEELGRPVPEPSRSAA